MHWKDLGLAVHWSCFLRHVNSVFQFAEPECLYFLYGVSVFWLFGEKETCFYVYFFLLNLQFTASTAISSYAVIIFKKLGSSINPYMSSILLAVSLTFGSLVTTHLADKLGRKKLNLISLLCSAHGLFITAIYHYLNINGFNLSKSFGWIPIISLCFVIFVSSAGVIPLSLICGLESLPAKVRTKSKNRKYELFSLVGFLSQINDFFSGFRFVRSVWR